MTESMDDYYFCEEEVQPLVYDFGTEMMKLGFSGDDAPRAVFPSIVGRPRHLGIMVGMDAKDVFVGDEAQAKRGILNLSHPMPKDRTEVNFQDLEKLIHHCPYNELCVTPEEHPLLFTPFYNMDDRMFDKIGEILFEVFGHPALFCCDDTVLSLIASGRTTGIDIDCGSGITATCIHEMYPIEYSKIVLEDRLEKPRKRIGGDMITEALTRLLIAQRKFDKNITSAEREIVRDIKEKLCFFAESRDTIPNFSLFSSIEKKKNPQNQENINSICSRNYELPDGKMLIIGNERFYAPEILFRPNLIGYDLPGIHEICKLSIERCHEDLQNEMYSNIVISGGTSMIENFPERLKTELQSIVPGDKAYRIRKIHAPAERKYSTYRIRKIHAPAERKYSTWIGGSILSSLSQMREMWVGKNELKERGNYKILQRKCQMATKKNDQIGIFNTQRKFDIDLKERVEYVLSDEECVLGFENSLTFDIKFTNSYNSSEVIKIRFKSFLLL